MLYLKDIFPLPNLSDYKVHFARHNGRDHPLDVWARSRPEWKLWQQTRPGRDDFNRPYIFALAQFYPEPDVWMFGGVFEVTARHSDRYDVEQVDLGRPLEGRLKLHYPHRDRVTRSKLEKHYDGFVVKEILPETYSGRPFPGYDRIDLPFAELEGLLRNGRLDWQAALENVKGIYLISDRQTGRLYVGSACGDQGIWSRWSTYAATGHGGNVELRKLLGEEVGLDYCRRNFRLALLEEHPARTPDSLILERESYYKEVLMSRGPGGLNRN
ncbi:GIY-YIG nuclease family protein [Tranquillimonas alkanivorans]|uniref:GIY-YIG domain-containing protein n=1 Tax=Tranquillimonas alkanivorans TaxID=441119 RepID=A0A1I5TM62_9RHOB|nr:GIY-YIG nuclease family protein [Tranquillimonas alkanivorans]SFP83981.1 hypothetical protein SAMN04488047_11420 [Tranquillimonas alkanivorans]